MLVEEHGPELLEAWRRIVQGVEEHLPLRNGEGEHLRLGALGVFQPVGELVVLDEAGELEDQLVANGETGHEH